MSLYLKAVLTPDFVLIFILGWYSSLYGYFMCFLLLINNSQFSILNYALVKK
jgi:hypothetical protein